MWKLGWAIIILLIISLTIFMIITTFNYNNRVHCAMHGGAKAISREGVLCNDGFID